MATLTLGTAATNTLAALLFSQTMTAADLAALQLAIKNDQINGAPVYPGAFAANGLLYVPNRGVLKVLPGDFVAVGSTSGWPILLSANAASSADFIHT
jgi:hypothetical protein